MDTHTRRTRAENCFIRHSYDIKICSWFLVLGYASSVASDHAGIYRDHLSHLRSTALSWHGVNN